MPSRKIILWFATALLVVMVIIGIDTFNKRNAVAYLLLFLPFEQLSVEALSGLLLAVVFYHLSLLQALPDGVGYVVALDYAFYLVYLLLSLELLILTLGHDDKFTKNEAQHKLLILSGRVSFPVIIFIGFLALYLVYF